MTERSLRDHDHRRRARPRRRWLSLAAALVLLALIPAQAAGHAVLTHSAPHANATVNSPPQFVRFDFNEPVEVTADSIRVFDADGNALATGEPYHSADRGEQVAVDLSDGLPAGVYTATYRVVSADGHPVSGGFSFGVGVPVRTSERTAPAVADLLDDAGSGPVVEVVYGFARGLAYLAILLVIGACFFRALVWQGAARWPTSLLFAAGLLGLVASAVATLMQAALVSGMGVADAFDRGVLAAGLDTRAGGALGARTLLFAAIVALLVRAGPPSRARFVALVVAIGGVVATLPLAGHADAASPRGVLIAGDVVHVLAAGAWLGSLILLLASYWPRRRAAVDAAATVATSRFSRIALPAIVILVGAGLLQSWFYLDADPAELVTSGYGLLLVAKVLLLGVIVALAARNRRRLAELAGAATAEPARPLRRAMRAEVIVALVVLAVTAVLVRSAPPADAGGPADRELDVGPIRAELIIEPATTGPNDYHLYLFDRETGEQVRRVKEATLRLTQADEGIGPISLELPFKNAAHYELLGPALGVPGTWEVALDLRVSRFEVLTATTEIEIE